MFYRPSCNKEDLSLSGNAGTCSLDWGMFYKDYNPNTDTINVPNITVHSTLIYS